MTDDLIHLALSQKVRLRLDIQWYRYAQSSDATWVVRDPLTLEYFHLSELERSIACLLDGNRTLGEVLHQFEGLSVTAAWLLQFVAKLEDACLLVPRKFGDAGRVLWGRSESRRRNSRIQRLLSPLAISIPLFDPTHLLNRLTFPAQVLFSKTFALLAFLSGVSIFYLVLNRLLRESTNFSDSLLAIDSSRAAGLLGAYLCVKSIHELGHALACRRWNAECHEVGVLLLAFMPCLYCDTSDCWKLSDRWRRASVAAAGIYVEFLIAIIAAGVWLITSDVSPLHSIAANTMLVCSINTLVVNANPLLRYDGYYVLSDIWNVPNLADQSREATGEIVWSWLTGKKLDPNRWDASPNTLAIFGAVSSCYRLFVIGAICWLVWAVTNRIGVPLAGLLLISLTLVTSLTGAGLRARTWWRQHMYTDYIRPSRLAWLVIIMVCALWLFFWQRMPTFVATRAVTNFSDRSPIFAKQSGVLLDCSPAGRTVQADESIARLSGTQLRMDWLETLGEVRQLELRAEHLKLLAIDEDRAAAELASVIQELSKNQTQLEILEEEISSLEIRAPHAGTLLSGPPYSPQQLTSLPNHDRGMHSVLDETNLGSWVNRGDLVAWIVQPGDFMLTAYVGENDAKSLQLGMPVRCRWDCELGQVYTGRISKISPDPIDELPETLIGERSFPTRENKLEQPHYEVDIELAASPPELAAKSLATVHIQTPQKTAFEMLKRFVDTNIRPAW